MPYLSADSHGLMEVGGSNGKNHEFLHGQFVSCMASSINDIKCLQKEENTYKTLYTYCNLVATLTANANFKDYLNVLVAK